MKTGQYNKGRKQNDQVQSIYFMSLILCCFTYIYYSQKNNEKYYYNKSQNIPKIMYVIF